MRVGSQKEYCYESFDQKLAVAPSDYDTQRRVNVLVDRQLRLRVFALGVTIISKGCEPA